MNVWESKTSDELTAIALTAVTTSARLREMRGLIRAFAEMGDGETVDKLLPLALAYAYTEGIGAAVKTVPV